MQSLLTIMARLRDPKTGCPWDVEQDFASIAPYTIEEAYEVADAITRGDMENLREELGDLLLQVVFHAQMAAEQNLFTFADVAQAICDKMIRRHPHVFADATIETAQAQTENWENIKAAERKNKRHPHPSASASTLSLSEGEGAEQREAGEGDMREGDTDEGAGMHHRILDGIPAALPALMRAQKLQSRAARVGFDWPDVSGVLAKVHEELAEVEVAIAQKDAAHTHEELGDLLFAVVNLARFEGIDAESALRDANAKFTRRFAHVERGIAAHGKSFADITLDTMEALWLEAKQGEHHGG